MSLGLGLEVSQNSWLLLQPPVLCPSIMVSNPLEPEAPHKLSIR